MNGYLLAGVSILGAFAAYALVILIWWVWERDGWRGLAIGVGGLLMVAAIILIMYGLELEELRYG